MKEELAPMFLFGGNASGIGVFNVFEAAERLSLSVYINVGIIIAIALVASYALYAGQAVGINRPVSQVLRRCCKAQIRNSVVGFYVVDVVKFKGWPFSIKDGPCYSVRQNLLFLFVDNNRISAAVVANTASNCSVFGNFCFPVKIPSVRVVRPNSSGFFRRQMWLWYLSHTATFSRQGMICNG